MIWTERLTAERAKAQLEGLVTLLQDAVDGGASLGFLPPLSAEKARQYWLEVIEEVEQQTKILLVAFKDKAVVGTVQLALATKENAPHRAEVQKLCVLTTERQQGIGQTLMGAIEEVARVSGRSLLVLDTRRGDPSVQLYTKLGYIQVGIIPQYVKDENGKLEDTVVFYRII